jgi:hypothetical protein
MHEKYLGDSYDLVKRFFCQSLGPVAPLYAHQNFVPSAIRDKYKAVTTIPILGERPQGGFGVLLDPDTGVCLPAQKPSGATARYVSLPFIVELNRKLRPYYIVCFDQSYYRKHELSREAQRGEKMKFLRDGGLSSFYFKSHAPFLFIAQKKETLGRLLDRLVSAGIPECRFQLFETSGTRAGNS